MHFLAETGLFLPTALCSGLYDFHASVCDDYGTRFQHIGKALRSLISLHSDLKVSFIFRYIFPSVKLTFNAFMGTVIPLPLPMFFTFVLMSTFLLSMKPEVSIILWQLIVIAVTYLTLWRYIGCYLAFICSINVLVVIRSFMMSSKCAN